LKLVIIAQEEPVYFSPFFRGLLEKLIDPPVLIVLAGSRGAGAHPGSRREKLENIVLMWRLLEPAGFIRGLLINLRQFLIRLCGLTGSFLDKRSLKGAAQNKNIPMLEIKTLEEPELLTRLKEIKPDLIVNQSELLLKGGILHLARIGILNRHGSLLPQFRGRLASFWGHCQEPPVYGATIHLVDEKIDSGAIVAQKKLEIDPASSYPQVLEKVFAASENLMIEAIEKLKDPDFVPKINPWQGTPVYRFPGLKDIERYREILKKRRSA